MTTSFLRPLSVQLPPQGAYEFLPQVFIYEDTSAAGLEALINAEKVTLGGDVDNFWVIESVEYQVTYAPIPMDNSRVLYSALVHATQIRKI